LNSVLRIPGFRHLLLAYTLNELAWPVGTLALSFLVYRRTGSAIGSAAFFLASQFVPALLSPLIVARLSHLSVRRVLTALYALEAVIYLILAWLTTRFSLVPVLALTLLDGTLALAARPIARATSAAVTMPRGALREANAILNVSFSTCFMVGPAIGGAVVVAGGTEAAMIVNAGLFFAISATFLLARQLPRPAENAERQSAIQRLRAGVAHIRGTRRLRALLGLKAVAIVFFTVSVPVDVVFAVHSLHAGAAGYGALLSTWGGGAVCGSLIFARLRRASSRELIAGSCLLLAGGFLLMAAAPSLVIALIGAAFGGIGNGMEGVATQTALQEATDPEWMTLVMSVSESVFWAIPGLGIVLGGAIAELFGARAALATGGAGAMVIAVAAWRLLREPATALPVAGLADPGGESTGTGTERPSGADPVLSRPN
jgi:predicted MFS family arabinose efflux permease